MVHDKTDKIGCGVARYMTRNLYTVLITCNYGAMNWIEDKVYLTADYTNAMCNRKDGNLCKDSAMAMLGK